MDRFWSMLDVVNAVIWHQYVLFVVLGVGVLFTLWSLFGQYRALTHGVQVIRGKYDDKHDPGAINHFQALSTALSATVGLGNIAGVAIAISLGGPGAVFWMWVTGLFGMALKMTEVTQSMIYRDTSDPENPHGGPMFVVKKGFQQWGLGWVGAIIGGIFVITLFVSTITGGNMFQAHNVADIGFTYFSIPKWVTGLVLTIGVGAVIIGGIKRIGDVAGRVVPFMCGLYLLAGLYVIVVNFGQIPGLFALIFREAFAPSEAVGAFVGGTAGYGFLKGMQRALFSNEAGQGSAPIAHSAAKTDEPVREGVVAGLEPFIDTLVVCTITAMVILLSGAWNRAPALVYADGQVPAITEVTDGSGQTVVANGKHFWSIPEVRVRVRDAGEAAAQMKAGTNVFFVIEAEDLSEAGTRRHRVPGVMTGVSDGSATIVADARTAEQRAADFPRYAFTTSTAAAPAFPPEIDGVFFSFNGATLTAKAFDRVLPGLGMWIVPATAFLFAFSTMISWSYYGEQAVVYLLGRRSIAIMGYRVVYCLLILVTTQIVNTEAQLDILSTFGTGVMLWANIPIMLIFGPMAMKAYHDYMKRLKSGQMSAHRAPPLRSVVEGSDVE
ncbi:MAG: amino acid carrier protein [Phycisphaerales bacterium]|nr:amino acid carrier protein [Phycisphaerales bacterium]